MRTLRGLGALTLVLAGVVIGRAQDPPPPATLSPMPEADLADGQLVGGLHLPSGGWVMTAIYLGKQMSIMLPAGDYLVFKPVGADSDLWILRSGSVVKGETVEGPKVFAYTMIEAEYVRREAAEPRFVDAGDGWRAAEYPLPDGRAVQFRIQAR